MTRFRYLHDPLCRVACLAYAANRWLLAGFLPGSFFRGHFADLLLIPAALPPMLWLHRRLGWRHSDAPPRWSEVLLHLAVWSIAAEYVGPHLFARATGDTWDVAAYAAGAVGATVFWRQS